jgi:MFS family permease
MTATEQQPGARRDAWILVGLLSVAFVINYMDRQVVFAIFPLLRSEMGFSETQLGLVGSLFTWTYSLAMPFSGRLADIFPKHRMVIFSLILWSIATVTTALSRDITEFLISRVFMGLSESLYVPAAIALITQAHPGATRSRALAVHGLAQFSGITLGGWYGGWAGEHIGWRSGLLVLSCIGVIYGLVVMKFLRAAGSAPPKEAIESAPRDLLRSSCYITLAVTFATFCGMLWMLYAWLPSYVYETFHLTLADSGLTATLYLQSGSAAGAMLGGYLGDRLGSRHPIGRFRILTIGLFCCAPMALATFAAPSLLLLRLSALGFGLFAGLFVSNIFASAYDIVAKRNFGLATGVINMAGGLGSGSAILLTGVWKQSASISSLMALSAGAAITMAIVLTVVLHLRFQKDRARVAATAVIAA